MSNKSNPTVATMGIDIGKNSFHVVEVRLADIPPCLIGMEACVGARIGYGRYENLSGTISGFTFFGWMTTDPERGIGSCPNLQLSISSTPSMPLFWAIRFSRKGMPQIWPAQAWNPQRPPKIRVWAAPAERQPALGNLHQLTFRHA